MTLDKQTLLCIIYRGQRGDSTSGAQLPVSCHEDGMHCLDGCSKMSVVGGYFSGTLEGGQMGDNLELFGEVLGLCSVFCLFYYYTGHIHA